MAAGGWAAGLGHINSPTAIQRTSSWVQPASSSPCERLKVEHHVSDKETKNAKDAP